MELLLFQHHFTDHGDGVKNRAVVLDCQNLIGSRLFNLKVLPIHLVLDLSLCAHE